MFCVGTIEASGSPSQASPPAFLTAYGNVQPLQAHSFSFVLHDGPLAVTQLLRGPTLKCQ